MYVVIEVPEITDYPSGFPHYWLKTMFIGSVSNSYQVNALTSTYIRLVEAALVEYRLGQPRLQEFWNTHDSINLPAMHSAISHFETCLTDMHRAIACFIRLRRHRDLPDNFRSTINADKPEFIADLISDRLREMRNAIHHLEERVVKGDIQQGEVFVLSAQGLERPHESEPNNTVKTIDRLKIGSLEIQFSELAGWLVEMARYADKISTHEIPK